MIKRIEDEVSIRKVATDLIENKIFTSAQIRKGDEELLGNIFMPLLFGALQDENTKDIGVVYEYYSEAGTMSINGYPMFMSCRLLHKDDWKKVLDKYKAMRTAIGEVK